MRMSTIRKVYWNIIEKYNASYPFHLTKFVEYASEQMKTLNSFEWNELADFRRKVLDRAMQISLEMKKGWAENGMKIACSEKNLQELRLYIANSPYNIWMGLQKHIPLSLYTVGGRCRGEESKRTGQLINDVFFHPTEFEAQFFASLQGSDDEDSDDDDEEEDDEKENSDQEELSNVLRYADIVQEVDKDKEVDIDRLISYIKRRNGRINGKNPELAKDNDPFNLSSHFRWIGMGASMTVWDGRSDFVMKYQYSTEIQYHHHLEEASATSNNEFRTIESYWAPQISFLLSEDWESRFWIQKKVKPVVLTPRQMKSIRLPTYQIERASWGQDTDGSLFIYDYE